MALGARLHARVQKRLALADARVQSEVSVQAALEQNVLVEEFWDAPDSHLGATVAKLVERA